jgi:hypothetical protein
MQPGPAPMPGPGPWAAGGPPQQPPQQRPAPQPPSGRSNKTGLIIGFVLVLAVIAVGGVYVKNHLLADDGEKTEVTSYQLTLPVTTGDFRIAKPAEKVKEFDQDRLDKVGLSNPKGVTATYYAGITADEAANMTDPSQLGSREVTTMGVFGAWGKLGDPETAVDGLMEYGIDEASKTGGIDMKLVDKPQKMTPAGFDDGVMKCQYAEITGIKVPVCAWADGGTIGFVTLQRQNARGPVDLPLTVAADHTAALHTAALVTTSTTTGG